MNRSVVAMPAAARRDLVRGRRWPAGSALARAVAATLLLAATAPASARAQAEGVPRVTVTWRGAPIHEVMLTLADVSGRSIVVGRGVTGFVTATITDQPWDAALEAVATGHGLVVDESPSGILRIQPAVVLGEREAADALVTRTYRIDYVPAAEMRATLEPLLTERGSIGVVTSTNTLVVSDVPRVQAAIAGLLR